MNVAEAVAILLTHFPPEERGGSGTYPGRGAVVMAAINAAMQEYYASGPSWLRRAPRGEILRAPATITVDVTKNSRTIAFDDWAARYAGCTIAIDGAAVDNQILEETKLLFPYDGNTGTKTATVLHDCITLDSDVQAVLAPVRLADGPPLHPVASPEQLTLGRARERDYGHHNYIPTYPDAIRKSQATGTPLFYFVDGYQADEYASPTWRMLVSPAPSGDMLLSYRVRVSPPNFTDAAATDNIPVPHSAVEAIIIPLAAERLSASPFFNQGANVAAIIKQAEIARRQLFALSPQGSTGVRMRPGF